MTHTSFLTALSLLHPMTRERAVLAAADGPSPVLAEALLAHTNGPALCRALGGAEDASPEGMAPLLTEEARRLLRLCAQCGEGELLAAAALCPGVPTAEALSALVERRRREEAMTAYALQLLWRLCGEGELPDAMTLFPQEEERNPALEEMACDYVISQLKGGDAHA